MRIVKSMITDIIDIFGTSVRFSDQDDSHVVVSVLANETAVVQFAKNFSPDVIVLAPEPVRDKVICMLREGLEEYK